MRPALSIFNPGFPRGKIVSSLTGVVCYRSCGFSYILGDFVAVCSNRRNYSTQYLLDSTSEMLFSESEVCDHPSTSVSTWNNTEFAANNIGSPEICYRPSASVSGYYNNIEFAANNIGTPEICYVSGYYNNTEFAANNTGLPEIRYHPSASVSGYYNNTEFAASNIGSHEIRYHPSTSVSSYYKTAGSAANYSGPPLRWSRLKDWQEERIDRLTASTFSQAVGFFSRRRVQLWLEKIGAIEPFPIRCQSDAARYATMFSYENEEQALKMYKLISGNNVSHPDSFTVYRNCPNGEWLGASPDGFIYRDGWLARGVLEIKCPYFSGEKILSSPWKRVPCYYIPQAQGLMEISDAEWMDLFVWTIKGFSLFRIYRDREYWHILKAALEDFWQAHVQPAKCIFDEYVITDPCKQLEELKPAPKHELCAHLVVKSREISGQSSLLVRGNWDDFFRRTNI